MYQFHRRLQEMKHLPEGSIQGKSEEGVPCPICGHRSLSQIKKSCLRSHLSSKHLLYFPFKCQGCGGQAFSKEELLCSCGEPSSKQDSVSVHERREPALEDTLDGLINLIEDYTCVKNKLATFENAQAAKKPPREPQRRSDRGKSNSKLQQSQIQSNQFKAKELKTIKKEIEDELVPEEVEKASVSRSCDFCKICRDFNREAKIVGFRARRNHVLEHLENDTTLEETADYRPSEGINSSAYKLLYSRCFPSSSGSLPSVVYSTRRTRRRTCDSVNTLQSSLKADLEADERALEKGVFAEVLLRRLSPSDFPSVSWDRNSQEVEDKSQENTISRGRATRSRAIRVTEQVTETQDTSFRKNECRLCRKVIQSRYQLKHTLQEHYNKGALQCPYCHKTKDLDPSQLREHVETLHAEEDEKQKNLSRPLPEIQDLHQKCFPQPKEVKTETHESGYDLPDSTNTLGKTCNICFSALSDSESKEDHIYQHLATDEAKARFICIFPGCEESFFTLELILRHCKWEHSSKGDFKDMKAELKEDYLAKRRQCFGEEASDSDHDPGRGEKVGSALKRKHSSWVCEFCDESQVSSPVDHAMAHMAVAEGLHRFRCIFEECQAGVATQSALIEHVKLVHSISEVCRGSIAIMDQISDPEMAKRAVIWWRSCFKTNNGRIPDLIRRLSNETTPRQVEASRRRPERFIICRSCTVKVKPEEQEDHVSAHLEKLRVFQFICTLCHQNFKSWKETEGHEHPSNSSLSRDQLIRNRIDEPSFQQAQSKTRVACFGLPISDTESTRGSMTNSTTTASTHPSPESEESVPNCEVKNEMMDEGYEKSSKDILLTKNSPAQFAGEMPELDPVSEAESVDDLIEDDNTVQDGPVPNTDFDSIAYGGFPM